jgi:hypothetical protein
MEILYLSFVVNPLSNCNIINIALVLTYSILIQLYIHTTHALSLNGQQRHLRYSSRDTRKTWVSYPFYQNLLAMRNIADVIGGKSIAVLLQSISGVSAINPLSPFTTSREKRERCYTFILSETPHMTKYVYVCVCESMQICVSYIAKIYNSILSFDNEQRSSLNAGLWNSDKTHI